MADLTPDQQEQEEFEFRARAEQEARQQATQAAAAAAPSPTGAVNPSLTDQVVGGLQTAGQLAMEHPAALAAGAGVWKASNLANKYLQGQQAAATAANSVAQTNAATSAAESASRQFTSMMGNYTKMSSDIRQYQKMGQPVPQELLDSQARLGAQIQHVQSTMPGYNANITGSAPGAAGSVSPQAQPAAPRPVPQPTAMPTQAAGAVEQGAASAADHANIMSKIADLYKAYGPAVADHLTAAGKAIAETGAGRALGTAARIAGSAPVLGAQLATYSSGLNTGEDEELAKKHALQNQMMAQKWGNSPTPNAVNSGFTGQLNNLQRQSRYQQ